MRQLYQLASIFSAAAALSACQAFDPVREAGRASVIDAQRNMVTSKINERNEPNTGRVFIGGKFINRKIDGQDLPDGFVRPVTIGDGAPLSLFSIGQRITAITRIPVNISPDLIIAMPPTGGTTTAVPVAATTTAATTTGPSNTPLPLMSVAFSGSLPDLLDRVASRMSIAWEYRDGSINFSRYITRIYTLNMFPGKSSQTATVGKSGSASTGGSGSTGGASGGGSFSSSSTSDFSSDLDAWGTLDSAMSSLKSSGGKYSISSSSGMIVVTDTKDAQDRVAQYIKKMEKTMNRQVTLRVSVISVENTGNEEAGVNWNLVWNRLNAISPNYSLSFKGIPMPGNLSTNGGAAGLNILTPTGGTASKWDTTSVMFQALNSVSKASMVSNNTVSALNKQPLSVSLADQTGFASSTSVQQSTGGVPTTTTTVSTITSGFILNVTPSVTDGDEIALQFSLDLSNPPIIQTFGQIQIPTLSGIQIAQRARLKAGETLVLTGFSVKNSSIGKSGMFTPDDSLLAGGNRNNTNRDRDLVILITPELD